MAMKRSGGATAKLLFAVVVVVTLSSRSSHALSSCGEGCMPICMLVESATPESCEAACEAYCEQITGGYVPHAYKPAD
nr:hypothetical protein DM860_014219 [Ipomoea trifida]GMC76208.1 Thionin related/ Pollen Ole E 6 [Ipomoea batatas]